MLKLEQFNDQSFDDIVELAVKGIARFDTQWNNFQAADPGMTLVDLFAWLKAVQHEYMSVILPESQRRFLELLDIRQRRAQGAQTLIRLSGAQETLPIPAQTKWLAGDMVFENPEPATAFAASLTGVRFRGSSSEIALDPSDLDGGRRFPVFPGLGPEPDREPQGEMVLTFNHPLPPERPYSLYFGVVGSEARTPVGEEPFAPLADLRWEVWTDEGWQTAQVLRDDTHDFLFPGLVTLCHSENMAQREDGYVLRVRLLRDDYDMPPFLNAIYFNVVEVRQQDTLVCRTETHGSQTLELTSDLGLYGGRRVFVEQDGRWRETERYELEVLPMEGRAVLRLPEPADGILAVSYDQSRLPGLVLGSGAGFSGHTLPFPSRDVRYDSLELLVGWPEDGDVWYEVWQRRDDFYASSPQSRHFVLEERRDEIRFGDHIQGTIPPKGRDNILLCGYQTCRGKASEIKAGRIRRAKAASGPLAALTVEQIAPAVGGRDGETFAETVARAGDALRSGDRAVTEADYLRAVRATPGLIVENCRVLTGFDGPEDSRVTVVIQGAGRAARTPRESYERNIRMALDRRRMLNTQIHVVWPRVVRLVVRGCIAAAPYYHDAEALVRRRIEDFVAERNQTFGNVLSYGELYCAVDLLDCVSRIDALSVEPVGDVVTRTRTDDIVVSPNSLYEIERFDLRFTGSL